MGLLRSLFGRLFGKQAPPRGGAKPELLIVGLGNPAAKYDGTRHNIGFDVIDRLIDTLEGVSDPAETCDAFCWAALGGRVMLAKPLTYMNLSGDAVGALLNKFGLTLDKCLIIVDDFNIPLGKLRIRKDGTHGGHNGLKSVSATIGDGYPRLRVGIGPLPEGVSIIDFVLGKFCDDEQGETEKVIKTAAEAAAYIIENSVDAAMNKYN